MGTNAQPDWEDLRHFLALADGGSLSAAARQLGVDHSTVARRVAALEAALGLRLIDRLPRAVTLTPEGRRIAARGGAVTGAVDGVLRAADAALPDISGEVRISAPPALATVLLAPVLARLRQRHPGLTPVLLGTLPDADLDHREADIALRLSRQGSGTLIARRLCTIPFGFYAAPDHDLPEADWTLIGYEPGIAIPQQLWLDRWRGARRLGLCTNDALSQAAAARAGAGVALLPRPVGDADPGLTPLPGPPDLPERELWMLVHADLRRSPRIRAAMDHLAAELSA